jgi:hypothetical protein
VRGRSITARTIARPDCIYILFNSRGIETIKVKGVRKERTRRKSRKISKRKLGERGWKRSGSEGKEG